MDNFLIRHREDWMDAGEGHMKTEGRDCRAARQARNASTMTPLQKRQNMGSAQESLKQCGPSNTLISVFLASRTALNTFLF